MDDFQEFMRAAANRIATQSQATPAVEGYVYDGADGFTRIGHEWFPKMIEGGIKKHGRGTAFVEFVEQAPESRLASR